ncbi:hypothetical protein H4R20_002890 [Coemansia guatemalensis]|uniref:Uncharacterized protein n=1 Tax=Coemansia guatemalensis TaxID=2761395 RepID=A0A9W8HZ49_9FUNG|nr:hypothetical protein H4R20_002890 [Coemansia guatemalensis]
MLSSAANPSGAAADSTKSDAKCWLPELDAPRISLDLSSLSQSGFSADAAAADPSATVDPAPASHTTRQSDSSTSNACSVDPTPGSDQAPANPSTSTANLYAGLSEYAGMVADRNTPQPSTDDHAATQSPSAVAAAASPVHSASVDPSSPQQLQQSPSGSQCGDHKDCHEPPTASANDGDDNASHLGLVFDFHTNPEVDAISTSPLFAISEPAASGTAAEGSQHQQQHTPPSQSPRAAGIPVGKQPLAAASDAEPISRKSRSRRASIAGMLMRRASKYVEATPSAIIATASFGAEPSPDSDNNTNAHAAAAQPEPLPESPLPAAQHVPSKSTVASSSDASIASSRKDKVCDDPPLSAATRMSVDDESPAHGSGDATTASGSGAADDERSAQSVGMDTDSDQASSAKEDVAASSAEPITTATPDQGSEHGHHLSSEELPAEQSHTGNEIEDLAVPPAPPARSQSLEKRSSRILSGISRKVNHVRQTTSMVLRRSVGSRLSMIPGKSLETLNHAAQNRIGVSAANQDHSASTRDDPPEYSVDDRIVGTPLGPADVTTHQGATTGTANTENGTATVDTERAVTTPGDAPAQVPAVESAASDDETAAAATVANANVVENSAAAAADPKLNASAEESSNDSLDARATFSRRFGMVRRGTNEAVRSGVSRMRNMFAAKKPVTA